MKAFEQWLSRIITLGGYRFSKALVKFQQHRLEIKGIEKFADLVCNRNNGLISLSNHISVMDDPLMWAALPERCANPPTNLRWVLAAHDICFKNIVYDKFFRLGQTLPIKRFGAGPFQESVEIAINGISNQNQWFHIFPEGFINNRKSYEMRYFRWGTSRLVLETKTLPPVMPIFITGFEKVMPDDRGFPRFYPRPRQYLHIEFGEQIEPSKLHEFRSQWYKLRKHAENLSTKEQLSFLQIGTEARELRSQVASYLRDQVENLRPKIYTHINN